MKKKVIKAKNNFNFINPERGINEFNEEIKMEEEINPMKFIDFKQIFLLESK